MSQEAFDQVPFDQITTKTAFKRFTKGVEVDHLGWAMIGMATYAKSIHRHGEDILVDVQPITSFRKGDSPGTLKAFASLAHIAEYERTFMGSQRRHGTWQLHPRYMDHLLNQVFRWIHPSDYGEHENVQILSRLSQHVPANNFQGHYYMPVVVLDGVDRLLHDRGQTILRLLARSKGWVPASYDLDAFEAGMFAPEEGGLKLLVTNTTEGPVLADRWEGVKRELLLTRGYAPSVISCDWFMRLWDYYIPKAVRFCVGAEARLGASLGNGDGEVPVDEIDPIEHSVVLMYNMFANYNSSAHGANMVEGRISSESELLFGAKLGGGASTMGTMEGIDDPVTVGPRSLVGANGNAGISLGADCVVAAGVAPQAGQRMYPEGSDEFVEFVLSHRNPNTSYDGDDFVYGRDLSGVDGLQFTGPGLAVRQSRGARRRNNALYG